MENPADCVLFISESMAKFIIAWNRRKVLTGSDVVVMEEINASYSPKELSMMVDAAPHQVKIWLAQAIGIGIVEADGVISEVAQKCVHAIIAKKLQEIKG